MNSKMKGNIGIGLAIAYFTKNNYTVSIPINDSQDYDLIVEQDGFLYKVQVKYTGQKAPSGNFIINLRSISGTTKQVYKTVKDTDIEILFVVTSDNQCYLLHNNDIINNNSLTLTKEYVKYKVEWLSG